MNEEESTGFIIDNDEKAEWAIRKIKEAQDEHDRLTSLIELELQKLDSRQNEIDQRLETDTAFLKGQLMAYMRGVKCKESKTQDSYQLLSGKLIRKKAALDYEVDPEALIKWLGENGREDLVQVTAKPKWGEFKKLLAGDVESGAVVIAGTGEAVDGVKATEKPESFSIKFN